MLQDKRAGEESLEQNACAQCGKFFETAEALAMHASAKHAPEEKKPIITVGQGKVVKRWLVVGGILLLLVAVFYLWMATPKYRDPPFEFTGQPHTEAHPPSNFVDEPIQYAVQIHIIEHNTADIPGVLVQYNCKREAEACQKLAADLKALVSSMDTQKAVYVAPYYETDALVVLSGRGKMEKLKAYDESRIRLFLNSIGVR